MESCSNTSNEKEEKEEKRRSKKKHKSKPAASETKLPPGSLANPGAPTKRAAAAAATEANGDAKIRALKAELLAKGQLFEDPDFPAVAANIYFSENMQPSKPYEWKRPKEICHNPKFFVGGASRFDIRQGQLGDCWLLAAISCLSMHPQLFSLVVPPNQEFSDKDYCGLIHFRFWQYGQWIDIVVDDRLPTKKKKLLFMHSTDSNEFWSALLEKAYAKMMGSYEALIGGTAADAMVDFTGGIVELFHLRRLKRDANLLDIMIRANKRSSLMSCSINSENNEIEGRLPTGLITGHAYSVTDAKRIKVLPRGAKSPQQIGLIRIRNPWGDDAEWNGAWSDNSPEWTSLPKQEKEQLCLQFDNDGEFWMSFDDFVTNFHMLEICHLGPDSLSDEKLDDPSKNKRRWEAITHRGSWKKKFTAGGCRNYLNTFWTNPQFRVTVVDPDEEDEDDKGTIIVGLMQMAARKKRTEAGLQTIGFVIYQLRSDQDGQPLDMKFFKSNRLLASSPSFINSREISGRYKLKPGRYVIVPSTYGPDQESEFLIRIYSEQPSKCDEIDDATQLVEVSDQPEIGDEGAMRQTFEAVAGEDMEIDAFELRDFLNTLKDDFQFEGFCLETCRSLVALMDLDQSGKLSFDEFKLLLADLTKWGDVFTKFDTDKSGNFNSYELREALNSVGFHVNNKIFNCLVMRHSNKQGIIEFNDFIICCARLKTLFETFKVQKKDKKGVKAQFSLEDFLQSVVYM